MGNADYVQTTPRLRAPGAPWLVTRSLERQQLGHGHGHGIPQGAEGHGGARVGQQASRPIHGRFSRPKNARMEATWKPGTSAEVAVKRHRFLAVQSSPSLKPAWENGTYY